MSKYFNSIVTCHRDRRLALRSFLRAFSLVVSYVDKDSFEIVITDMDEDNRSIVDRYTDVLNINLCRVKHDGIFCRGKALNHAVLNARGEYVTPIDIDSIVPKHFLTHIEDFYYKYELKEMKLCHRIRKLDIKTTIDFLFSNFGEDDVSSIVESCNKFIINRERYTKDEIIYNGGDIDDKWLNGDALGTSQFTMLRSIFMKLGGYDEGFVGYGCEDLDFNTRAYKFLGGGYLIPNSRCSLYHLANMNSSKGYKGKILSENYNRYLVNKENNIISIPISYKWGTF